MCPKAKLFNFSLVHICLLLGHSQATCVHDDIIEQLSNIPTTNLKYRRTAQSEDSHVRRSITYSSVSYSPLRITPYFHELSLELFDEEQNTLRRAVHDVIHKISTMLSVIPVDGPLLLARTKCFISIAEGNNTDKCAGIQSSDIYETCLDEFIVPQDHVDGLYLWNETHPEPIRTIVPRGHGIPNTDYILYIQAKSTNRCILSESDLIAYASYCQLDQHSRPIAGFINFCPRMLRHYRERPNHVSKTMLHELLHALGFSAKLFSVFQSCRIESGSLTCRRRNRPVRSVRSSMRLMTPLAITTASAHFDCSELSTGDPFGPVLQTQNGKFKSHWDAAFMYSSIMTPTIGQPDATILDNITLSVLEDSGWYKVNYSHAEPFVWGQDEGCDFGLYPDCVQRESHFFCNSSRDGCHYLHRYRSECRTDEFLHGCYVDKPKQQGSCISGKLLQSHGDDPGEVISQDSRCFLSNLTGLLDVEAISGHCYRHKCDDLGQLYVKVNQQNWTFCPWGEEINVTGYRGVILCPQEGVLCLDSTATTAVPSPNTVTMSSIPYISTQDDEDISNDHVFHIEIKFTSIALETLQSLGQETEFTQNAVSTVITISDVATGRITNAHLLSSSVLFRFHLHPSTHYDNSERPSHVVIRMLWEAVESGNFTVHLSLESYTASSYGFFTSDGSEDDNGREGIENEDDDDDESGLSSSGVAGIVIGTFVAVVAISLLIFYIKRIYTKKSTSKKPDKLGEISWQYKPDGTNVTPVLKPSPLVQGEAPEVMHNADCRVTSPSNATVSRVSDEHVVLEI